jgi:mono/diheme cytochrome c family protein
MAALRLIALGAVLAAAGGALAQGAVERYREHCAVCHGAGRLGAMGPALLPESLARLRRAEAARVIAEGRVATQMPGFGGVLSAEEIARLVDYLYSPVTPAPRWTEADIRASRIVHRAPGTLPDRPQYAADPLNLFIVVEAGDHHVTVLDGERLEPIHRFASRYALHGGPKFSPDGRYVVFASRDGWISKFDLWNLKTVAEVRAGLNTRNAAVSGDGKWVMVANTLPHTLVLLDADLDLVKVIEARDERGARTSRVAAVYDAAPRKSFIAAMRDIPELWEISYDERAEPIAAGLIHDYRYREGAFLPGRFNPRRILLDDVLDDFFFTPDFRHVVGASRAGRGQVVHLDVRRKIADLALPGLPHLGSGISWELDGRRVLATPNLKEGVVTVIEVGTWKTVKSIPTPGPGFFLRSHEASRYAFADAMMSPHKDTLLAIDKRTLEVAARLRPEPGRTLAHVEFTRDGRYALASLSEEDGALIVFDAETLAEVKRIPMRKPVGKYNVFNKITRSEGTSR